MALMGVAHALWLLWWPVTKLTLLVALWALTVESMTYVAAARSAALLMTAFPDKPGRPTHAEVLGAWLSRTWARGTPPWSSPWGELLGGLGGPQPEALRDAPPPELCSHCVGLGGAFPANSATEHISRAALAALLDLVTRRLMR